MTDTLKHMRSLRDKACRRWKTIRTDASRQYYRDLRNLYNRALVTEKKTYFAKFVQNNKAKPKIMWRHINSLMIAMDGDNTLTSSHFTDPDALNAYFIDSIPKRQNTCKPLEDLSLWRGDFELRFEKVNGLTVHKIISSGASSGSRGSDGISMRMLYLTLPYSMDAILAIVNGSLSEGIFPDAWKCAIVTPIPKHSNPENYSDLRPINILPALSKVVEKCVKDQLVPFLETNKILPTMQSGFRKNHSTTSALLNITDDILAASSQGKRTILVLLDFSRAFDCVDSNTAY